MTSTEMRELDAWIGLHVMNVPHLLAAQPVKETFKAGTLTPHYTIDPAAAMQVLDAIIKAGYNVETWSTQHHGGRQYWCAFPDRHGGIHGCGTTLPLAIALFAKQLFKEEM